MNMVYQTQLEISHVISDKDNNIAACGAIIERKRRGSPKGYKNSHALMVAVNPCPACMYPNDTSETTN